MAVDLNGLGLVTVTTAGSPQQFTSTPTIVAGCSVQAPAANTGNIRIGGIIMATDESKYTAELRPGESMEIVGPDIGGFKEEFDLSRLYLDVDVNGEGVVIGYISRRP